MKPDTAEWAAKAEDDFLAASVLARRRKGPLFDVACYHCHQCAEKYLKAVLIEAGVSFPKTHDLKAILDLIRTVNPFLEAFRPVINQLTDNAVQYRYPGDSATREETRESLRVTRAIRAAVRAHFGLPD